MPDPIGLPEPAYVTGLAAALNLASEFRIPCPGHPYRDRADLYVKKRMDGQADGWAISSGTAMYEDIWTGTDWVYRGTLARDDIYRYTRDEAIAEAQRIAPAVTALCLAQLGPKQLGTAKVPGGQYGIRAWNGWLLVIGHNDLRHTRRRLRHLYPHLQIPVGNHEHVRLEELPAPPGYATEGTDRRGWVFSVPDASGALPITVFVPTSKNGASL